MVDKKMVMIMGETGSGKSSFINSVIGEDPDRPAPVGAEFTSCSKSVEEYLYKRRDGLTISLVDTPGFNNFEEGSDPKTDSEILQTMVDFLKPKDGELEPAVLSGVVYLHSINSSSDIEFSRKMMRQLRNLCSNDHLSNLVVVTTWWDEYFADDAQGQISEEDTLEPVREVLQLNKFLNELNDAGVRFFRTGHFNGQVPGPLENQFSSPLAIVEQLLGLEPDSDQTPDRESIQGCGVRVLVLADDPETFQQDLSGPTEQSLYTLEALQTVTSPKSDEKEIHNDLKQGSGEREWPLRELRDQWKDWEDRQRSFVITELKSFADTQAQMLGNMHTEMLKVQERFCSQVVELKQTLEVLQNQRGPPPAGSQSLQEHERMVSDLQTERAALSEELMNVKSALAEQTVQAEVLRMESRSIDVSGLRVELGEVKDERDRVEASKLETERELESTKEILKEAKEELKTNAQELARLREQVQAQAAESRVRSQQITSLEVELELGKNRSEELAKELQDQIRSRNTENKSNAQRIASLETKLSMEKRNFEDQGRELAHLRSQLQPGTQRIASLQAELEKERKRSEEQARGSTYLRKQLQDQTSKSELQRQRTASLETELEGAKLKLEEKGRELAKQERDRAAESEAHLQQVAYLEMQLKESKKLLEAQAQESARLGKETKEESTSHGFTAQDNELTPVKMRIKALEGRLQNFPTVEGRVARLSSPTRFTTFSATLEKG
ncbi:hypothetical protein MD484_g7065, partial [Candolleomyces efflorescens]